MQNDLAVTDWLNQSTGHGVNLARIGLVMCQVATYSTTLTLSQAFYTGHAWELLHTVILVLQIHLAFHLDEDFTTASSVWMR